MLHVYTKLQAYDPISDGQGVHLASHDVIVDPSQNRMLNGSAPLLFKSGDCRLSGFPN